MNFAPPEAKNLTYLPARGPCTPLQYIAPSRIGMCGYRSVPISTDVLVTSPPVKACGVLLSACLFVCLSFCFSVSRHISKNDTCKFYQIFCISYLRPWLGYVLPVLRMTSCFHIMTGIRPNQRRRVCFVQFARWRHQSGVRPRCLVEIARDSTGGEVCIS